MYEVIRESWITIGLLVVFSAILMVSPVLANTSSSNNYEASEAQFGAGAALETCSGEYCARATIGQIGGEDTSSESYTASFSEGLDDDSEPALELYTEPGDSKLGRLDTNLTAYRTMKVYVRSHLAGGYTLQVVGSPPSYEDYFLATPIEPIASLQGTEQFAINAVANPVLEAGGDPVNLPDEEVVGGVVLPKYATADTFSYIDGDIVALNEAESSQIRYTISMIVNVSGSTPAGHFSGDFSAVVTPLF